MLGGLGELRRDRLMPAARGVVHTTGQRGCPESSGVTVTPAYCGRREEPEQARTIVSHLIFASASVGAMSA